MLHTSESFSSLVRPGSLRDFTFPERLIGSHAFGSTTACRFYDRMPVLRPHAASPVPAGEHAPERPAPDQSPLEAEVLQQRWYFSEPLVARSRSVDKPLGLPCGAYATTRRS